MNETTTYGTVTDYATGEAIRPATAAEWQQSADAARRNPFTGTFTGEDGTAVYVDGGPESPYTVLVGDTYETPGDAAQYAADEAAAFGVLGADEA